MMSRAMLIGIAKPMPCPLETIAVLMPTTRAVQVQQRASRVARIDGRVGLDEGLVGGHAHVGAAGRRDDADGHGAVETEGIPDGDGPLPDAQPVRVAEIGHRQRTRRVLDLEHRQVRPAVAAHERRLELAVVGETHLDRGRVLHHVVVGQDVAARVHQDARARGPALVPRGPAAEEPLEELGAEELAEALLHLRRRAALGPGLALDLDAHVHHRGRDAIRDGDERVFQGAQEPLRVGRGRGRA